MTMTPRERMLTAMRGGTPDRVPCSPDTNWMIPAKMTGRPFWDVFFHGNPPIWKAYNDCVRELGIDGFSHHGTISVPPHPETSGERRIVFQSDEKIVVRSKFRCTAGEGERENTYLHNDASTTTKNLITDLKTQFDMLPYLMGDYGNASFDNYNKVREDMGERGVVGLCMDLPWLMFFLREPKEAAIYDYYDHPELIDRYMRMCRDRLMSLARQVIGKNLRPDFVFFPMSGLLTLQSEEIIRKYSLPSLKEVTQLLNDAGIVTALHCCGKERLIVEYAATETDLDCIDPLEPPPMGDCDLAELKRRFGARIALKGNLHTTRVMLHMKPEGVGKEALKCLDAAMEGGGYILSTGDQCGRDTPPANIERLLHVCEKYGVY